MAITAITGIEHLAHLAQSHSDTATVTSHPLCSQPAIGGTVERFTIV